MEFESKIGLTFELNDLHQNPCSQTWLSSRNFVGGIYCHANFFCDANFSFVFGPNFKEVKISRGAQTA